MKGEEQCLERTVTKGGEEYEGEIKKLKILGNWINEEEKKNFLRRRLKESMFD